MHGAKAMHLGDPSLASMNISRGIFPYAEEPEGMSLMFSFADFGPEVLCSDASWFAPIPVLSNIVHKVRGVWSRMLSVHLRYHLLALGGLMSSGAPLVLDGQVFNLRAEARNLSSDCDGHRLSLQWRGASSFRPCWKHCNVLKRGSDLAHRDRFFVFAKVHAQPRADFVSRPVLICKRISLCS